MQVLKPNCYENLSNEMKYKIDSLIESLPQKVVNDLEILLPIVRNYAIEHSLPDEERIKLTCASLEMTARIHRFGCECRILFFGNDDGIDYDKHIDSLTYYLNEIYDLCSHTTLELVSKSDIDFLKNDDEWTFLECPHIKEGTPYDDDVPNIYLTCFYCLLEGNTRLYERCEFGDGMKIAMKVINYGKRDKSTSRPLPEFSYCEDDNACKFLRELYLIGYESK